MCTQIWLYQNLISVKQFCVLARDIISLEIKIHKSTQENQSLSRDPKTNCFTTVLHLMVVAMILKTDVAVVAMIE